MQNEIARAFRALHVPGDPLVLFNAWDAGSARAVAGVGAKAIATGSWSVAAANGFDDGERFPLALAMDNLRRIVAAVVGMGPRVDRRLRPLPPSRRRPATASRRGTARGRG